MVVPVYCLVVAGLCDSVKLCWTDYSLSRSELFLTAGAEMMLL